MSATSNFLLPFDQEPDVASRIDLRDRAGRERAVDPRFNVALEASAGTGKTRVLVDRYVNLLRAGVDPANILAITFTRKAAAEMRERILTTLRAAAERGEIPASRWRELRDRTAEIDISTIDAFCLSLLREFPLEADLDPGFSMADETEVPRLVDESLDRALRICRSIAREDEDVALVFAQLGDRRARAGLAALLNRRLVAPNALSRYLARGPRDLTVASAAEAGARALLQVFSNMQGGLDAFIESGPPEPPFLLLVRRLLALASALEGDLDPAAVQATIAKAREYFLTQDGKPRERLSASKAQFRSPAAWQTHRSLVVGHAPAIADAIAGYRRDLNVLVARGVRRMYRIAETEYRRTLDTHAVLDFSDVLLRTLDLLRRMEEFSQSRYRLESRYHHVLVDEFQDTSRAQWELVSLLVRAWGEGAGLAHSGPLPPSIFIVGDRKQSIYSFRDADASILAEAAAYLEGLRPDRDVRRSISRSFRSVPGLLSFVNDVCREIDKAPSRRDAFRYDETDQFPVDAAGPPAADVLGIVVADSPEECAERTAAEIARLVAERATVRDRDTGVPRAIRPGDVGILFRTRESHREYEEALERRGLPAYVYKGLGFFDADEIRDVIALVAYLADPLSDLRAAALLRSRVIGLSDEGLRALAPRLADALRAATPPGVELDDEDRRALDLARTATLRWRGLVDRLLPAELLDVVLRECAYRMELAGPRHQQARENVKKIRALIRRVQNRGYATLDRIVAHLDRLAVGDEANAAIDALDAVNLMTVHASKGLEFPVVFVVNLARGTGNRRDAIRVNADPSGDAVSVSVGDFQSDADEDGVAREREETKRLLYVALTRARDRLYLGTVLKDGRMQPTRGSLAEVLPSTLLEQFTAAAGAAMVEWRTAFGAAHRFRSCGDEGRDDGDDGRGEPERLAPQSPQQQSSDFARLVDAGAPRQSVASVIAAGASARAVDLRGVSSSRIVGTVVHRLVQRAGLTGAESADDLQRDALGFVRSEEILEEEDATALADAAVAAYAALRDHPDVREIYESGDVLHEVPFTMRRGDGIVRGTIDCVVMSDGRVTVLEFKTGRRRPEHEAQAALYREAAERLFPGAVVDSRVIYIGGSGSAGTRPTY
jgi:ATP-dependent helicase/nuclease subunit A